MYRISANPEYARTLREEVQETILKYGWSKTSINKMNRMDSFLREIHRFYGTHGSGKQLNIVGSLQLTHTLRSATMTRRARRDFTFSDGTFVRQGGLVSIVEYAAHHDPANYDQPDIFDPWRFLQEGQHFTNTSPTLLAFGHGRHTW